MNTNLLKACVPLSALFVFSACVDTNYDLSDIDTTTEIKVNDLTLPISLEPVKLGDIITIDDNSKIKIVNLNGQEIYAVTEHGEFHSDDIEIDGFTASTPVINPTTAIFNLLPAARSMSVTSSYTLHRFTPQDVHIRAVNVDEAIHEIHSISMQPLDISVKFSAEGVDRNTSIRFSKLELNFLKGLTIENMPANYSYNAETGLLRITDVDCTDNEVEISLRANAVDFTVAGVSLENHTFDYYTEISLEEATMDMTFTYDGSIPSAPSQVIFNVSTTVAPLVAESFTGVVEYNLEGNGLNIDPVDLSDIPDFLSGDDTNLRLANPQIYLSLNNPVAEYGVSYQTGLQLVAVRPASRSEYNLDENHLVRVTNQYGIAGPYNFVISPSMPQNPLSDYDHNLSHVGFASLSDVLAGEGLPSSIEINLVKPELPLQKVTDFRLYNHLGGVSGTYDFFAPLALKTGDNPAVIVYRETKDGWNDEDIDKMTITSLILEADVDNDLPLSAELSVYPIDKQGNRIPDVEVGKADISAGDTGKHITVSAKGQIRHLDGVVFEAVVRPGSEQTLSPDQTITLNNIHATVSGSYITDF